MASRGSLNKALLIGNLTRDPELRYTPTGAAVCTFGVATNRVYTASDGTKKEEAEFHRIVTWNKLAELCSQLLTKGRKVYIEGRLQTRSWTTPAGESRQTTEIVADDMKLLDKKPEEFAVLPEELPVAEPAIPEPAEKVSSEKQEQAAESDKKTKQKKVGKREDLTGESGTATKDQKPEAKTQAAPAVQEEESTEDLIKDLPF